MHFYSDQCRSFKENENIKNTIINRKKTESLEHIRQKESLKIDTHAPY